MADETKRKLVQFLNRFDYYQAKGLRNTGWNPTGVMYDEKSRREEADDELSCMEGKELDRELRRQILTTLPAALLLLSAAAAVVLVLIKP